MWSIIKLCRLKSHTDFEDNKLKHYTVVEDTVIGFETFYGSGT